MEENGARKMKLELDYHKLIGEEPPSKIEFNIRTDIEEIERETSFIGLLREDLRSHMLLGDGKPINIHEMVDDCLRRLDYFHQLAVENRIKGWYERVLGK